MNGGRRLAQELFDEDGLDTIFAHMRNLVVASLIVGVLWGAWHLWPALTGDAATLAPAVVAQTFIRMIATSIIYSWLFNRSGGSLWLVMAAHAGHNIAVMLVQMPSEGSEFVALIMALLYAVVAALVVISGMRSPEMRGTAI